MKVSDYIVEYLISRGITDVFGYPGGMVTHLMDSFSKYSDEIKQHVCFHEQAGAFEACGYAQRSGKLGVAFATSGPGATNLITGICDAWFDSIPVLFITGQVNTNEMKGQLHIRQRGFQETDIVSMVKGITKYAVTVVNAENIPAELERAVLAASDGRKGPVLLDIPMNVLRSEIKIASPIHISSDSDVRSNTESKNITHISAAKRIIEVLKYSTRPCFIAGCGIKNQDVIPIFRRVVSALEIPVLTTMPAFDLLPTDAPYNYGFIGAYGDRTANFLAAKSDLIITLGARLDVRQVGGIRKNFAPNAKIIRVDIDAGELEYHIRDDEEDIQADARDVVASLEELIPIAYEHTSVKRNKWIEVCNEIRNTLQDVQSDAQNATDLTHAIGEALPDGVTITTDVGQNQVWIAQALRVQEHQYVLFSGGHGAMGYSLPSAIGAYYSTRKPVIAFMGDGGLQMNIQELEFLQRDQIPVKVVAFNNYGLGMIRHFQEMYFNCNYVDTLRGHGYDVPDLSRIAKAYGLEYHRIVTEEQIKASLFEGNKPALIEICIPENTYVYPKLRFGEPNQDQEPLLPREKYEMLMNL